MTAREAIELSIRDDRVVVLPWTAELEADLRAVADEAQGLEFRGYWRPERPHWCVRLSAPA